LKRKRNHNHSINVDENIEKLEKLLHHAGKETIPGYNKQVSLKPTGRSIWNSQINEALQESKKAFKSLKRNRQNNCETEYDSQNMIRKKRRFRSLQRQAHASKQKLHSRDYGCIRK